MFEMKDSSKSEVVEKKKEAKSIEENAGKWSCVS